MNPAPPVTRMVSLIIAIPHVRLLVAPLEMRL
jgi:hypothetical protein